MRVLIAFLLLTLQSASLVKASGIPISLYLNSLGQSNGVGKFGPVPPRLNGPQQHDYYYWIDGGAGNLTVGSGQLAPTYGYGAVFGSELSFGEAFTEKIAVVKVAKSGSPIAEWSRNGVMYAQLQATVSAAIADLVLKGYEPTVRGATWIQSEYDSGSAVTAAAYEANLTQLITDLRSDYGQDFRFVYNQLHVDLPNHWPSMQWVNDIRQAQLNVANTMPNVRLINVDDLELDARDYLHFSPGMQDILGQRQAKSFISPGDLNYDGITDGSDFLSWQREFHTANELQDWQNSYNPPNMVTSIPEPSTYILLLTTLLTFRRWNETNTSQILQRLH